MTIFSKHHAKRSVLAIALMVAPVAPVAASAQECRVDLAAVDKAIAQHERHYADILSDIGCDAPTLASHKLMCEASYEPKAALWRMGRLDDMAWAYAYENATKEEVDRASPPRDADFVAKRDACTDVVCLCGALIAHTNDSLGGESPYSAP